MKEFELPMIEGGLQIKVIIVTKTKKEAAKLLNVSYHILSNYGYEYEPKTEIAIKNPFSRFAYFDGGWLTEYKPEWLRKVMSYQLLANYIYEVNKFRFHKLNFKK